MDKTQINIRLKSHDLLATLDSLRKIKQELGDGYDLSVEIDYEEENSNESQAPASRNNVESGRNLGFRSPSPRKTREKELGTENNKGNSVKGAPIPWFRSPVYSSHDYDATIDAEVIDD